MENPTIKVFSGASDESRNAKALLSSRGTVELSDEENRPRNSQGELFKGIISGVSIPSRIQIPERRRERPCDQCRRRKSRCVIHVNETVCVLCDFHKQECTFTVPIKREGSTKTTDHKEAEQAKQKYVVKPFACTGLNSKLIPSVSSPMTTMHISDVLYHATTKPWNLVKTCQRSNPRILTHRLHEEEHLWVFVFLKHGKQQNSRFLKSLSPGHSVLHPRTTPGWGGDIPIPLPKEVPSVICVLTVPQSSHSIKISKNIY
jgi:hypothetical protein